MLADGTYDGIVVDAIDVGDGVLVLELTILAGPNKGELVSVQARGLGRDPIDLLAVPATITIADDQPSVALEG